MVSNSHQNEFSDSEIRNHEISHLINFHPFFRNVEFPEERLIYFYNHVDSILQKGPTCGIVVLLMAERLIKHESSMNIDLDKLLNEAKNLKLTNKGEMFSAKNIEKLANNVLNLNASTLQCMQKHLNLIIQNLFESNAILIPYDTDSNHEPCLKAGKKAHWCISSGFAFKVNKTELEELIENKELLEDMPIVDLKKLGNLNSGDLIRLLNRSSNINLLCKQGKSKYLKLFPVESLIESNKNLHNVDDSKDSTNFMIPENGISQTLCDRFVLITR